MEQKTTPFPFVIQAHSLPPSLRYLHATARFGVLLLCLHGLFFCYIAVALSSWLSLCRWKIAVVLFLFIVAAQITRVLSFLHLWITYYARIVCFCMVALRCMLFVCETKACVLVSSQLLQPLTSNLQPPTSLYSVAPIF